MHLKLIPTIWGKNILNIDGEWKHIAEENICVQWGELTGAWIKVHSDKFRTLYSSVLSSGDQVPEGEMDI